MTCFCQTRIKKWNFLKLVFKSMPTADRFPFPIQHTDFSAFASTLLIHRHFIPLVVLAQTRKYCISIDGDNKEVKFANGAAQSRHMFL